MTWFEQIHINVADRLDKPGGLTSRQQNRHSRVRDFKLIPYLHDIDTCGFQSLPSAHTPGANSTGIFIQILNINNNRELTEVASICTASQLAKNETRLNLNSLPIR